MSDTQAAIKKLSRRFPPGPRGYLLLTLSEFARDPLSYTSRLWKQYGDLVRVPFLPGNIGYLCAHAEPAEYILSTHQDRYGKPNAANSTLMQLLGRGILTSEGEVWRKHRRLMQPAFHQQQLVNLATIMVSCTEALIQEWDQKSEDEVLDITSEMARLTLKIVGLGLFSTDISDESNPFGQAFRSASGIIVHKISHPLTAPFWIPTPQNLRFHQAKQTLDRVILEIIQTRRQNPTETHDLLDILLAARDEETGEGLNDQQLLDEVLTLMVAGHDTLTSSLSWTWYLLGDHPDIAAQMQDELQMVLGGNRPTFEKLPQLQYTRRVFDEAMRLYPSAWGQARVALEEDEIQGYFVPKGTAFLISQFIIHRHPEFWDNPEAFDPDRFLPERVSQRPKFAYFPFGAGPRICIGKSFALMEAPIVLASIAQRFKVELVPNQSVKLEPTFTLRPKPGIKVRIRKRS